MCGIAALARLSGSLTVEDVAAVLRMMDAQVHRGPDDWGLVLSEDALRDQEISALVESRGRDHVATYVRSSSTLAAVLGTRRLSIIDLSLRGRMPMGSADGRLWITYNGEIYNSRDLRAELERLGYSFQSDTDTETILHGYEEWGEEVVQRLRGMFAFAILDTSASRLLLARDRFGIKPLYYYKGNNATIFASEVRALMRSELVPNERSVQALVRFLQLGSVPQPLTTVKDVLALPPAHLLSIGRDSAQLRQYWDLSSHLQASQDVSTDSGDCVSCTRSLIEESVRLHLVSDVPLGVFLSGGVDSSALVALASRFLDRPLTTVSIAFEEPAFDEGPYARLIAKQYRTQHHEVMLRSKDLFDTLPGIFAAMDQPSVDGVNTYFVSQAARRAGLTVVLSGTGGDEVFLGYDHFKKVRLLSGPRRLFGSLPAWARKGLIKFAIQAGARAGRVRLDKLSYLETPSDQNTYLLFRGLFAPRQIQDLLGMSERDVRDLNGAHSDLGNPIAGSYSVSSNRSIVDTFVLFEFAHYLNNQLLKDMDFMSMAHSIEVRVPYLDHKLVEYVAALPDERKVHNRLSKYLLIEAMRDDLPREVWDRPKMGFTFPFQAWLREQAEPVTARSFGQSLLDRTAVNGVWAAFRDGRAHWSRAWALAVLESYDGVGFARAHR